MEEQWRGHGNEDEEVEEGEDETSYPAALEPSFDGEDGGSTPYANSNGYYHEAYGKLEVLKPQERIPIRNWYASTRLSSCFDLPNRPLAARQDIVGGDKHSCRGWCAGTKNSSRSWVASPAVAMPASWTTTTN